MQFKPLRTVIFTHMTPILEKVRIDKYLWAIRLYKTRTLASEACDSGKIKINGDAVKPARLVKVGEEIKIRIDHHIKTIRVTKLIEKRVGAPIAVTCYEDLTSEEEKPVVFKSLFLAPTFTREQGAGRPTKRERRDMEKFRSDDI